MKIEDVLPTLRSGEIAFHGAYAHKLDPDGTFYADTIDGRWIEVEPDGEMLICNNWNLQGGPDWRAGL